MMVSLGVNGLGTGAFAQVPGTVGQLQQRQERPDLRLPAARESEVYDPKGVRVGSFKLFPEIEADEIFNDNLYATPSGRQVTFIQQIKPTPDLRSDWTNHMLNLYAKAGLGFYSVNGPQNNYQDVSVGGDGRLDIQRNWNVYGGASWNRRHEERGTPNSPAAGIAGNRYDQYYTFRAGVMYLPTPNFYVGPTYQFVHRTSNQFNSDYDQTSSC